MWANREMKEYSEVLWRPLFLDTNLSCFQMLEGALEQLIIFNSADIKILKKQPGGRKQLNTPF